MRYPLDERLGGGILRAAVGRAGNRLVNRAFAVIALTVTTRITPA
jgi:hypothetical protein